MEGRQTESKAIGIRLTKYSEQRVAAGVTAPLLPPERYLAQEALHLSAFTNWEAVLALDAPPDGADFGVAVYHYARRCPDKLLKVFPPAWWYVTLHPWLCLLFVFRAGTR